MPHTLYILYDSTCGLCSWSRRWLRDQPSYLRLELVPRGSPRATRLFPDLDIEGEELVVVTDEGAVYRHDDAWIVSLWALRKYRGWSERLASPLLRGLARRFFTALSENRHNISRWMDLPSDHDLAAQLMAEAGPSCQVEGPPSCGIESG